MKSKKQLELQKQLLNNIIAAIRAVEQEKIPAKDIFIPKAYEHLLPKKLHLPNMQLRIIGGEDNAYVAGDPAYRKVVVPIALPKLS